MMDAARKRLGLSCQFFVHDIAIVGDTAAADIEPYPQGTGTRRVLVFERRGASWVSLGDTTPSTSTGAVSSPTGGASSGADATPGEYVYPEVPPGANPSPEWTGQNTHWGYVNGYYRSNGTYVQGHYRRTH